HPHHFYHPHLPQDRPEAGSLEEIEQRKKERERERERSLLRYGRSAGLNFALHFVLQIFFGGKNKIEKLMEQIFLFSLSLIFLIIHIIILVIHNLYSRSKKNFSSSLFLTNFFSLSLSLFSL